MFVIDDITLIIASAVMAVALVSPFVNVLLVKLRNNCNQEEIDGDGEQADSALMPGISVVVTVDDDGEDLKENLPLLLEQDYKGEYQIIVVVSGSDELTENTLGAYSENPHLYTTFIPGSSRYMSRRKLAITVGVKAAKHEWILLTDVDCRPDSKRWLSKMAENCTKTTDIVLGYSGFEADYKSSRRFDHVYNIYRQLADAQRGNAWGYCGNNLMFRKSMFIGGKGFDGNLKYIRGEYDFIVNKFSTEINTMVDVSPDAMVTETELTSKGWRNKNMYYMSTRKRLQGTLSRRLFFNTSMWAMVIMYFTTIAAIAYSAVNSMWVLTIVASLALVLSVILRCVVLGRSIRQYLDDMSYIKMWWLELTMPLRNMSRMFKYKMTDKYDFICHKI